MEEAAEAPATSSGDGLIPPPTNPLTVDCLGGHYRRQSSCPPLCCGIRRLLSGEQLASNDPLSWMTHCCFFLQQEEIEPWHAAQDTRTIWIVHLYPWTGCVLICSSSLSLKNVLSVLFNTLFDCVMFEERKECLSVNLTFCSKDLH